MADKVKVKFNSSYIAARGPGIAGAKGAEKEYPMTDALKKLIDEGVVVLVKATSAAKREKAVKAKSEKA
jgi:UDP-N-acetylmuramyl pentapeptide synthase